MDLKNNIPSILAFFTKSLAYIGKLVWSCIMGIATIITFLLIFVLLLAILPRPFVWIISIVSLLWFIYNFQNQIITTIAILIAFCLALMLLYMVNRSLFPHWIITKTFSTFKINFSNKSFGLTHYKNRSFETLTCYGSSQLDSVSISGPLTIYGQLDAQKLHTQGPITIYGHAKLNDITSKDTIIVYGKLTLNKSIISGKTQLYGKTHIEQSTMDDLAVYAKKVTLTSSNVKNIYMKKDSENGIVTLIKTIVDGNIVFDYKKGRVILDRDSSIKGNIINGNIET